MEKFEMVGVLDLTKEELKDQIIYCKDVLKRVNTSLINIENIIIEHIQICEERLNQLEESENE